MLLLYAVAIGLVIGLVTRGNLAALGTVKVRFWPVALAGLAFQALLFSSPLASVVGPVGPSLYVVSTTLVLMALVVNVRQPGFWLVLVGAVANFTVILANGGQMPASPDALAVLLGSPTLPTDDFTNSVIAGPATPLYFLADIFVLPRPFPFANIFSIGDVLIGLGGAWFIVATMHNRRAAAATTSSTPRPARSARPVRPARPGRPINA